jgi:hypothetical protein
MLALLVVVILLLPVGVICFAPGVGPWSFLSVPYAFALLWLGLWWGGRLLERREEKLYLYLARSPD